MRTHTRHHQKAQPLLLQYMHFSSRISRHSGGVWGSRMSVRNYVQQIYTIVYTPNANACEKLCSMCVAKSSQRQIEARCMSTHRVCNSFVACVSRSLCLGYLYSGLHMGHILNFKSRSCSMCVCVFASRCGAVCDCCFFVLVCHRTTITNTRNVRNRTMKCRQRRRRCVYV